MWIRLEYRSDTCISVAKQEYIGICLEYMKNTCIPDPQREYVEIRAKSKSLGPWKYMGPLAQPRGGPWPLARWPLSWMLEPLCQGLILLIRRVHLIRRVLANSLLLLNQSRPHSLIEATPLTWRAQLLQLIFQIYLVQDVVDSNNM